MHQLRSFRNLVHTALTGQQLMVKYVLIGRKGAGGFSRPKP